MKYPLYLCTMTETNNGLTIPEIKEYIELKTKLFKGNSFVVFDDNTLASADFKRYDELFRKKLLHIKNKYKKTCRVQK